MHLKNTRLHTADFALSTMKIMLGMRRIDFMGHVIAQIGSLPFKCPQGDICKIYLALSGNGGSQM
jgi:hypothetical protein